MCKIEKVGFFLQNKQKIYTSWCGYSNLLIRSKKIQNISLFHKTFVYGWISMAIASSHQIPHHHRWFLPLWLSPRLTLSLIWVYLFSPSLKPSRGRASASIHTYRRWRCLSSVSQPLVAAGPALLFIFFFLFFNFYLPFRQDRNPFDTHFVSFFY